MISSQSGRVVVGCIDLIEQGCDRLGQIDVTGSLGQEAGEWFSAKLAAAGGKTAQFDHGLRDAEPEPDHQRLHIPGDNNSDRAAAVCSQNAELTIGAGLIGLVAEPLKMSRAR